MENCFVKKIKGVIGNSNLLKRGEVRFKGVSPSSFGTWSLEAAIGTIKVRVLGDTGAKFSNNSSEMSFSGLTSINTTVETDIAVEYINLGRVVTTGNVVPFYISSVKNCEKLTELNLQKPVGTLEDLPSGLEKILVSTATGAITIPQQLTGSIKSIPVGIKQISLVDCPYVTIDDLDFSSYSSLGYFELRRCVINGQLSSIVLPNACAYARFDSCGTSFTGSISSFVNANTELTTLRLENNPNLTGNVSDLNSNSTITRFSVLNTGFVGTAAQIKAKFPNASVTDASGGTA